jgi:hypothetical protein
MVRLEITLLDDNTKTYTCKTLQECAIQFFEEHERDNINQKYVSRILFYETDDPTQYSIVGGNHSCIESLKQFRQGVLNE